MLRNIFVLILLGAVLTGSTEELSAATFQAGDKATISNPVHDDLYISAGEVTINHVIYGDLVAAGGNITINDTIYEDVTVAGGDLTFNGPIGDDVLAAGGSIDVFKQVGQDLIVFGGSVMLHKDAVVHGDIAVFGGEIEIAGQVNGDVRIYSGKLNFTGIVNGNFEAKGGRLFMDGVVKGTSVIAAEHIELGSQAQFNADVEYWQEPGEIDFSKAMVSGKAVYNEDLAMVDREGLAWFSGLFGIGMIFFWIIYIIAVLLLIVVLQLLFDQGFTKAAETIKTSFWRSLGMGALYLIGTPLVGLFLLVTLVGLPIGVILLVNYGFSVLLVQILAALILANWIKKKYYPNWHTVIVMLIGLAIYIGLEVITWIPFIGWLVAFIMAGLTFGALIANLSFMKQRGK